MLNDQDRRVVAASIYATPLKPWETRCLRLDPGQREEVVQVHLEVAAITHLNGLGLVESGQLVTYEALSYTWGSSVFSHDIRCNGLEYSVTANLHAALVHLRHTDVPRRLWIDALCINQYDVTEKGHQVLQMFHLYKKATTVVVWLGAAGKNTKIASQLLTRYDQGEGLDLYGIETAEGQEVHPFLNPIGKMSPADPARLSEIYKTLHRVWDGLEDLLGRPWLRRTWVIQELSAASKAEFHCGDTVMSYRAFVSGVPREYSELPARLTLLYDALKATAAVTDAAVLEAAPVSTEAPVALNTLHELRGVLHDATGVARKRTRVELLLSFFLESRAAQFEASVAVDQLYSLIAISDALSSQSYGLTNDEGLSSWPKQVDVDYSIDLRTALLRAVKMRMNEVKHFYFLVKPVSMLQDALHVDLGYRDLELPTKGLLLSLLCPNLGPDPTCLALNPTWLGLLRPSRTLLRHYWKSVKRFLDTASRDDYRWAEQDVMRPDALNVLGKCIGRLVTPKGPGSGRVLFDECLLDAFQLEAPPEDSATLSKMERVEVLHWDVWRRKFLADAKEGDLLVTLQDMCALIRPQYEPRRNETYTLVATDVTRTTLEFYFPSVTDMAESYLRHCRNDLDTFVLV